MTSQRTQTIVFVIGLLALFGPLIFKWWWEYRRRAKWRTEQAEEDFGICVHIGTEPICTFSSTRKPTLGEIIRLQLGDQTVFIGRVLRYEVRPKFRGRRPIIQYDVSLDQGFIGGEVTDITEYLTRLPKEGKWTSKPGSGS